MAFSPPWKFEYLKLPEFHYGPKFNDEQPWQDATFVEAGFSA